MKTFIHLVILSLFIAVNSTAYGENIPTYEIENVGVGKEEGTALYKVHVYGTHVSEQELILAAVHGVVFKGCLGSSRNPAHPAMASADDEQKCPEFCKSFFSKDGKCQEYATPIMGTYERIKIGSNYKFSSVIKVNTRDLRKYLEENGLINPLSSGL